MEFRLQDGTWDVVLGPFRSTDHNGDLASRAVGEMPPAVFEAWAAYAPETTHPLVRARLHHLLWVARHGTKPIEHLRSAVHSYRDAAGALLTKAEEHLEALVPSPEPQGAASSEVEVARLAAADALVLAYDLAAATRQPERTDIVGEMIALGQAALAWKPPSPGVLGLMTAPLVASTHDKPACAPCSNVPSTSTAERASSTTGWSSSKSSAAWWAPTSTATWTNRSTAPVWNWPTAAPDSGNSSPWRTPLDMPATAG
ncbi:hypothetical protein ACFU9X_25480 [Streptomyces atratus]|uniref:DUF7380 domain-containing protein n=1 Tax=Streptomyces atratus TaxID=1893 RepID=UPI0036981C49